jgi:hypothetical protein
MRSLPVREALRTLILRELRAARRELESYPDDASVWRAVPGIPNTSGTLALHLAGNLQHFFGAALTRDGYTRDREAEFARRDVPRAELLAGLDAAAASVERALQQLPDDALTSVYPLPVPTGRVDTLVWLMHLTSHLAYHLGQMDYHRRVVTGNTAGVDAVSVRELPKSEG